MNVLICGVKSVFIAYALWFAISYYHTHAILKHPIRDGYCTVEDLLIISFATGIMISLMR